MAENALVSWIVRQRPWELEDDLIAVLDVPLNLMGNKEGYSGRPVEVKANYR